MSNRRSPTLLTRLLVNLVDGPVVALDTRNSIDSTISISVNFSEIYDLRHIGLRNLRPVNTPWTSATGKRNKNPKF